MSHATIKRVLITDPIDRQFVETLRAHGLEVDEKKLSKEQLLAEIADYDALVVRSGTQVTGDVIAAGKQLKLIGRAGTGVDNIDVPAATKHGVLVMNTPGTFCMDFMSSVIFRTRNVVFKILVRISAWRKSKNIRPLVVAWLDIVLVNGLIDWLIG